MWVTQSLDWSVYQLSPSLKESSRGKMVDALGGGCVRADLELGSNMDKIRRC